MIKDCEIKPLSVLDEAGISYIRLEHERADTMELCADIGKEYGAKHCKNLFLTNRNGSVFYLLMMDAEKPFRTSIVSKSLGSTRLSFGSDEKLREILGLEPGSVSVMGLVNDCARKAFKDGKLKIAIDSELFSRELILVHPNTNTASLVLKTSDIKKLLLHLGIDFITVDIQNTL